MKHFVSQASNIEKLPVHKQHFINAGYTDVGVKPSNYISSCQLTLNTIRHLGKHLKSRMKKQI